MQVVTEIMKAVSWTLLHSLWQGVIFALLAALFISIFRKAGPVARYSFLLSLLALFAGCFIVTFYLQLSSIGGVKQGAQSPANSNFIAFTGKLNFWTNKTFAHVFTRFIPYMFSIWFIATLLKLYNFYRQYISVTNMRSNAVALPHPVIQERFRSLANSFHLTRKITLLQSTKISVPLLVGYSKPIILFPVGFVNNLSIAQVEAILLHEILHIKRNDYLVNLVQTLFESVLFFNPAFRWISTLVRKERENCCDDAVIEWTGDRRTYVATLVKSYEFSLEAPGLGLYFAGKRQTVVPRVERLVEGKNLSLKFSAWALLVFGIACCLAFFPYFSKSNTYYSKTAIHYHDKRVCYNAACKKLFVPTSKDSIHRIESLAKLEGLKAEKMIRDMIRSMLRENVIITTDNLSFRLDHQKLIVNGQEQASCITQMLQDDFLKKTSLDHIEYNTAN